jgi:hypothetical protein
MERLISEVHWGYYDFVLRDGILAERGTVAVFDTGENGVCNHAAVDTGLVGIGIFMSTLLGDGVKTIQVKLFRELISYWWDNDPTDAVTAAMRGQLCYWASDRSVSSLDTGTSVAGLVLAVDATRGVLVASDYPTFLTA